MIEAVCAGLLMLMLFGLGLAVSIERGRRNQFAQCPADPADRLYRLVRAHGNAAEYVPAIAALLIYSALAASSGFTAALAIWLTLARLSHAWGLIAGGTMAKFNRLRFFGGLSTYVAGSLLAIATILSAIADGQIAR